MPSSSVDPNLIPVDNPILGMIDAEAARQGVDRNLAHTVAQMESGYDPTRVSPAGAMGVFQLMPGTAQDMGVTDPMNAAQNISGGIKYLKKLGGKYGADDTIRILAGYNAGPGNVDKYGGVPPFPETANYVDKGMRLLANASPADLSHDPNLTPVEAAPVRAQAPVDIRPPLSEPPTGQKPAPPEKTVMGFLNNATEGLGRIFEPLADPGGTLQNITNLFQGMSEKTGFAPVMGQSHQQSVDAIANMYKQRYGSWDGFKEAWYHDPVGMAGDVAAVFSAAGLGKAALGDFLEASGLERQAAGIADIPKAPQTAAGSRFQAGVQGAADAFGQRARDVLQAGIDRAPSGVLGGVHGMIGAAKYGAGKKAFELLREGWQKGMAAYDAAASTAEAAAAPAAEAAIRLTPEEQAFWKQFAGPAAAPVTPPDLAAQQTELAAQGSMSPRVMPRSEAAQVFPEAYDQPAAEPPTAPPLTPQELTELETGRPPSRQSAAAQQTAAETLATARAAAPPVQVSPDVAPSTVVAAPAAAPSTTGLVEAGGGMADAITGHMYDALWKKVQAGDITEGGQPSAVLQAARIVRANGGLQTPESFRAFVADYTQVPRGPQFQAAMRDLVARHSPAAPPAAPVAPEAPATAATTPPAPEAPTGPLAAKPKAAAVAQQLEEMTRPDRITGFLKANFADLTPEDIDKFDPHDWELIGQGAGGKAPTAEQIAEVKANLAPLPREVAKMAPTDAKAAVASKLQKTPASPVLTAPQARVEAFAQHFAKDTEMTPEAIASIADNPEAAGLLEELGRSLKIKGKPAPGEIQKIADRVRELRGAGRKPR